MIQSGVRFPKASLANYGHKFRRYQRCQVTKYKYFITLLK